MTVEKHKAKTYIQFNSVCDEVQKASTDSLKVSNNQRAEDEN